MFSLLVLCDVFEQQTDTEFNDMFIIFGFIRPKREAEESFVFVEWNDLQTGLDQFPINTLVKRIQSSKLYERFTHIS